MSNAVLIIEDEAVLARNLQTFLVRNGYEARTVENAESGLRLLESFRPDLVLLDYNLPGINGLAMLARIRTDWPEIPVIMITGSGSTETAVSAMKGGAVDYLIKPIVLSELKLLLERLVGQAQLAQTASYYRNRDAQASGISKILGESPAMLALKRNLQRVIDAEANMDGARPPVVLITGETGTGKELVARALHFDGSRRNQSFVELNCGALPANLIEAELFGYERGAFTGAVRRKAGLAETAHGGTLFLDEIGETDLSMQVKLLKLLEEQKVRSIGGLREQQIDVRVISATNQPLERMVEQGRFRSDLYYRLRMIEVKVPALRDRGEDILLLARHYLAASGKRYRKSGLRFSPQAESALLAYPWPGNVRELKNLIEQVAMMSNSTNIELADIPFALISFANIGAGRVAQTAAADDDLNLERMERKTIVEALRRSSGNVTQAARTLGISRDTLRYRMERIQIRIDNMANQASDVDTRFTYPTA